MNLAWGAKVSEEFRDRVVGIAANLGCDPSWLMACMAFETGRTFSPSIRNDASGATGLIQFIPSTARGLGTTTEALSQLTAEEQLEYVHKYFKPFAGRIKSLSDCYMAILWPAAVGLPDDTVIFGEGSRAYLMNKGLDLNKDGGVTKAECTAFVEKQLHAGLESVNAFGYTPEPVAEGSIMSSLPVKAALALGEELLKLVPWVKKNPAEAEKIIPKLMDVARETVPGANEQEVVHRITTQPETQKQFVQNVATKWSDVAPFLEHDAKERAAARAFNTTWDGDRLIFGQFRFVELLSLLFVIIAAGGGWMVLNGNYPPEMKGAVITLILISGFTGVKEFWLGSSRDSQRKTEIMSEK